jgi:hypothetical protein
VPHVGRLQADADDVGAGAATPARSPLWNHRKRSATTASG